MAKNKTSEIPHYELLFIVPNRFTEDEAKGHRDRIHKLIEDKGGQVTYSEVWGKKKFCYPVKHEHYGYYFLAEFNIAANLLDKVHTEIRMDSDILRHMIVSKAPRTLEEIEAEKKKQEAIIAEKVAKKAEEAEAKLPPKEATRKISSKELDDKLDKILETDDLL
jgi:small subunit ribosomal protein S6